MSESLKAPLGLVGRILLSLIFILAGIGKLTDWSGTEQYMAAHGMVAVPFFLTMAVLFELGAGTCLLLGWQTRWAALALIVFLIPTTLIFHNFWAYSGPQRMEQMHNFLKNIAIMGGLTTLVAAGAVGWALDNRRARSAADYHPAAQPTRGGVMPV
jgi:putative oxidoreductase